MNIFSNNKASFKNDSLPHRVNIIKTNYPEFVKGVNITKSFHKNNDYIFNFNSDDVPVNNKNFNLYNRYYKRHIKSYNKFKHILHKINKKNISSSYIELKNCNYHTNNICNKHNKKLHYFHNNNKDIFINKHNNYINDVNYKNISNSISDSIVNNFNLSYIKNSNVIDKGKIFF